VTPSHPVAGGATEQSAARSAGRAAPALTWTGRLRDGTPVGIRPLVVEDRGLLLAGFSRLSSRSRYSRFLRAVSDAQFERMLPALLDDVDQRLHVAVVLYAEGQPIGVSRLVRPTPSSSVADLAVTVADDWQGRGAGTVLAQEVLVRAGGVREIHTVVSEDNPASLRMLAGLGESRSDCLGGTCDVVVRVNRSKATTPEAAAGA
jgi:RimJ/RimL family protein N-acetyltransferase